MNATGVPVMVNQWCDVNMVACGVPEVCVPVVGQNMYFHIGLSDKT